MVPGVTAQSKRIRRRFINGDFQFLWFAKDGDLQWLPEGRMALDVSRQIRHAQRVDVRTDRQLIVPKVGKINLHFTCDSTTQAFRIPSGMSVGGVQPVKLLRRPIVTGKWFISS